MTPETENKYKKVLAEGYSIGQVKGVLYHVFSPTAKPLGIFSSESEAIKNAYNHFIGRK